MDENELEAIRKNSDLCRHCDCRGDMSKCKETDCSLHDSWYVTEIMLLWKRSTNDSEELISQLKNAPQAPSPTRDDG
jgi:hypothetical protein